MTTVVQTSAKAMCRIPGCYEYSNFPLVCLADLWNYIKSFKTAYLPVKSYIKRINEA